MKVQFTKGELNAIARRTAVNYHGENFEKIAKKINSPLEKDFKEINKIHKEVGYLPVDLFDKRNEKLMKLQKELKKKLSAKNYAEVMGGL